MRNTAAKLFTEARESAEAVGLDVPTAANFARYIRGFIEYAADVARYKMPTRQEIRAEFNAHYR